MALKNDRERQQNIYKESNEGNTAMEPSGYKQEKDYMSHEDLLREARREWIRYLKRTPKKERIQVTVMSAALPWKVR